MQICAPLCAVNTRLNSSSAFAACWRIDSPSHRTTLPCVREDEIRKHLNTCSMMFVSLLLLLISAPPSPCQDRLKTMPGYSRYQRATAAMTNAVKLGSLSVTWKEEGKAFEYQKDGKRYRFDVAAKAVSELSTNAMARTNAATQPNAPVASGCGCRLGRAASQSPSQTMSCLAVLLLALVRRRDPKSALGST